MKQFTAVFFRVFILITCFCIAWSCESDNNSSKETITTKDTSNKPLSGTSPTSQPSAPLLKEDTLPENPEQPNRISTDSLRSLPDSAFVRLLAVDTSFVLDMKYATEDNFLKTKVYSCDQCFLRKKIVEALLKAQAIFKQEGYGIKLYDCYRPLDVQKKMWAIMPDDRYVGNPYGNGSVHNKGAAVDITLVDSLGNELDMGTPFDYFGREAHHAYRNLPEQVLANRRLLKRVMEEVGFQSITSEWWHYSFRFQKFPVANFVPSC